MPEPVHRFAAGLGLAASLLSAAAMADERLDKLSPENRAVAERMVAFMERTDEHFFGRVEELNEGLAIETLERETDDTVYDVRVSRGPVVAKAGRMLAEGKKTQPGRTEGELVWGRFYSLDVHADTPLVGMLHATLVLQFYADGTGLAGGWLGVMNGTRIDEDMEGLARVVDRHFERHDRDPALYRKLMMKGTHETNAEFRRRPDPAGVSFYGPPVFRGDVAQSYAFIETLFEAFTDEYLDIVARRADDEYTAQDVERQDEMRKRWLIDQLYSDPFASQLVPFEVWSLANVPPVIKF